MRDMCLMICNETIIFYDTVCFILFEIFHSLLKGSLFLVRKDLFLFHLVTLWTP